ncbi:MAG: alpha-L-fucosidase [Armatimonadota bacterium]
MNNQLTQEMSATKDRMLWWRDAKFGMMVHWGLYSILAGEWKGRRMNNIGEWIMSDMRIPIAEYEQLAARFNPTAFDADKWVSLARRAGMKYLIVTAKHHDGFAMYHSKCDPYNIVDATPFGRDIMAEYADACKKHNVRLCVYYSQSLDWHERGGGGFDADRLNFGMSWCNDWDFQNVSKSEFTDYFERKVKPQVRELLTQYGPIGEIWFDCPFTISLEQSQELYDMVRSIQPDCIMNSRLGNGLGDFGSLGDNQISGCVLDGDYETVATLNDTWGYKSFDQNWKSTRDVLTLLTSSVGKKVNYVLNIGPTGEGVIPEAILKVLGELGDWMDVHSESIHATLPTPFQSDPPHTSVTQKPGKIYLHLHRWPEETVQLRGLNNAAKRAYLLSDKHVDLPLQQDTDQTSGLRTIRVDLSKTAPAELLPVLALDIDGLADVQSMIVQQPDLSITLPAVAAKIYNAEASQGQEENRNLEPDGQVVGADNIVGISPMGAVINWFSPNTMLTWDFVVLQSGAYEVKIVSTGLHHSNPWEGGHKVKVQIGGSVLTGVMEQDETIDDISTRYYTKAASVLGNAVIDKPGIQSLALCGEDIQFNGGVGLAVMSVVLAPV